MIESVSLCEALVPGTSFHLRYWQCNSCEQASTGLDKLPENVGGVQSSRIPEKRVLFSAALRVAMQNAAGKGNPASGRSVVSQVVFNLASPKDKTALLTFQESKISMPILIIFSFEKKNLEELDLESIFQGGSDPSIGEIETAFNMTEEKIEFFREYYGITAVEEDLKPVWMIVSSRIANFRLKLSG